MSSDNERAIYLVAKERARQVNSEGFDANHDAQHRDRELIGAAICYLFSALGKNQNSIRWPFEPSSWKPSTDDPVRDLVKAGALIIAEIERIKATREYIDSNYLRISRVLGGKIMGWPDNWMITVGGTDKHLQIHDSSGRLNIRKWRPFSDANDAMELLNAMERSGWLWKHSPDAGRHDHAWTFYKGGREGSGRCMTGGFCESLAGAAYVAICEQEDLS